MNTAADERARRYIVRLLEFIRDATQRCSAASEEWNKLADEFNDWYERQFPDKVRTTDGYKTDLLHYTRIKKENLQLIDAEARWSHWEREVQRLSAALNAEKVARDLMKELGSAI